MNRTTFLILALALWSAPVYALRAPRTPTDSYRNSIAVFIGEALTTADKNSCQFDRGKFSVLEVFKGTPVTPVELNVDRCVRKGDKFLLYEFVPKNVFGNDMHKADVSDLAFVKQNVLQDLRDKVEQIRLIDNEIQKNPEKTSALLHVKAAQFLYWHDYAQSEETLRRLIALQPDDDWAYKELMHSLYEQRKPKDIWQLHSEHDKSQVYSHDEDFLSYIAYAKAALGISFGVGDNLTLKDEKFSHLRLSGNKIWYATFDNAFFDDCDFKKTRIERSDIIGSYFFNCDFTEAELIGARMDNVNFHKSELQKVDFSQATLSGSIYDSDFSGANFRAAKMIGVTLGNSSFENTDFSDAQFLDVNFQGADLERANLKNVSFRGSTFDCRTRWPNGFDPIAAGAKLTGECIGGARAGE